MEYQCETAEGSAKTTCLFSTNRMHKCKRRLKRLVFISLLSFESNTCMSVYAHNQRKFYFFFYFQCRFWCWYLFSPIARTPLWMWFGFILHFVENQKQINWQKTNTNVRIFQMDAKRCDPERTLDYFIIVLKSIIIHLIWSFISFSNIIDKNLFNSMAMETCCIWMNFVLFHHY